MKTTQLVEHFFRHEYGRLVAMLSRRIGVQHIEAVEDAVQTALMRALDRWTRTGPPDNPTAWLFRVAQNELVGELRTHARRRNLIEQNPETVFPSLEASEDVLLAGEIQDDLLRMLFVCCDSQIPADSQLVLALKVLCGFSTKEIALRLFTSEGNVNKRLSRARQRLREAPPDLGDLSDQQVAERRSSVHRVIYLLFTEGYLSSHAEFAIRRELCDDALRLATLLADHSAGKSPETYALVALLHLHGARMAARQDASGGLLLLEEQDRRLWDQAAIQRGMAWLAKSAQGESFSRYHAEAGVAAEHCLAPSFEQTRWNKVVECYELLNRVAPSALHQLNRAVAIAEWKGPAAALALLDGQKPPTWLAGSYQWAAVLADLHRRNGDREAATRHRRAALASAPTPAIAQLLRRRLGGES